MENRVENVGVKILALICLVLLYVLVYSFGVFLSFRAINDLFHYYIPFNFDTFSSVTIILFTIRMMVK